MSGHSHWAGIKHKKALEDTKRGNLFSKIAKMISVAIRDKGSDPDSNPQLRMAIEKAREVNMPNENIERAIKRGAGELEGAKLEEILLEIYGPEGAAILVEGITDNKNRTLSAMRKILSGHNAKLANEGSVKWMFGQKGAIEIKPDGKNKEELELLVIDSGAEDFIWNDDGNLVVYTPPDLMYEVKQKLEKGGARIESSALEWIAQNPVALNPEQRAKLEKLFEALDQYEDVQEIYSNVT